MDWGPLVTAALAAFSGIGTGVITWLAARKKNHAEATRTHAEAERTEADTEFRALEGFHLLVQEMRQERMELTAVIEKQGERIEIQSAKITRLQGEVADLKSELRDILRRWRSGEPPPSEQQKGNR